MVLEKFRTKPFHYNLIIYFPRVLTTIKCLRALLSRPNNNKPSHRSSLLNETTTTKPNKDEKSKQRLFSTQRWSALYHYANEKLGAVN